MAELLWVDNDARLLELIAALLEERGHRVRTVGTFEEACSAIAAARPDLLLSDIDLGTENARQGLPRMARQGGLPPTLVVSGYLDQDLTAELSRVPGVVGCLAKPFDPERLLAAIDDALARAPAAATASGAQAVPDADDEGWIEIAAPGQPGREGAA